MKEKLLLTVLVICICWTTNAQESIRFGASAGLNFSGATGDSVEDTDSRTGFRIAGLVDIPVTDKFAVQPTAAIVISGWKDMGFDIKANYVVIEAKADYEIVDNLSLQAGPSLGFNIHASFDGDDINNWESTNFGALVGAQYEFPMGLFLNVQYDMGFTDVLPNSDIKLCNISTSVGYFF